MTTRQQIQEDTKRCRAAVRDLTMAIRNIEKIDDCNANEVLEAFASPLIIQQVAEQERTRAMKKLTLATFKSFIREHHSHLYIRQDSKFDGMTDCVEHNHKAQFWSADPAQVGRACPHNLGYDGIWLVLGGRDYFKAYENAEMTGIACSNCCGSFVVAVFKATIEAPKPAPVMHSYIINLSLDLNSKDRRRNPPENLSITRSFPSLKAAARYGLRKLKKAGPGWNLMMYGQGYTIIKGYKDLKWFKPSSVQEGV